MIQHTVHTWYWSSPDDNIVGTSDDDGMIKWHREQNITNDGHVLKYDNFSLHCRVYVELETEDEAVIFKLKYL